MATEAECEVQGGGYQGNDLPCDPNPCLATPVSIAQVSLHQSDFVVELRWTALADRSVAYFDIYRATATSEPERVGQVLPGPSEFREYVFQDPAVEPGRTYFYWIEIVEGTGLSDRLGPWEIETKTYDQPTLLSQRPSPARAGTHLSFYLPQEEQVVLQVFDAAGHRVHSTDPRRFPAGVHDIFWSGKMSTGRSAPTGVYLFELRAGREQLTGKILIAR